MGDANQLLFLEERVPTVDGPALEVGSLQVGSNPNFRGVYKGNKYVGVDMRPGPGVDVVCNIESAIPVSGEFALVICCSVLEHVRDPWEAAANITLITRHGGQLYVSVPWVWRYHPYPDDYWRFSWSGVKALFPDFEWGEAWFSTKKVGEFFKAERGADDRLARANGDAGMPFLMVNMIGTRK